ncbi:AMP-binding protein [uncultured Sneathiella sp.]|jgi:feruloyl-CoA synthase|uniref:AMP-binding protein n=1 Tax=uncultured Sneathiella sp. TaxID=879315 RepID=UPI0030D6FC2E|tara:strand:+ start:13637 stop:15544 length:1908 start_codon:yes stop_codon:yes gene_type:complete
MPSNIPFRPFHRPAPDISATRKPDGSLIVRSNIPLGNYEANIGAYWRAAADRFPDRAFLVKCSPDDTWPELSYRTAREQSDRISSYLLSRGYGPDKSIMILSSNSFAHATLMMGAVQVGIPVTQLSPSYSLVGNDFTKLKYAVELTEPGMIFAEDGNTYAAAFESLDLSDKDVVTISGKDHGGIRFDDLLGPVDSVSVEAAFSAVTGESLAKILFTSGSTGMPKAVPNTHEMLCAAQKTLEHVSESPDAVNDPTRVLDWLPWHHTYGGNVNFFGIARVCGTLFMDDGKPTPGLFGRTIENLKRISPSRFSTVPAAYSYLADQMEEDEELGHAFFKNVKICQYGGAALSQEMFERMQQLAIKYIGMRIPFGTGWGATETTGTGTAVHWDSEKVGLIGVPTPGITVKILPVGEKLEIRIKGPNVHAGYYKRPDLTAQYFDEEGYYCIGDAVKWVDPDYPEKGMIFDGRVAEDFKLANGTWVSTGSLRLSLIDALDPLARDVVIAGHDRDEVGILVLLTEAMQKKYADQPGALSADGRRIVAPALIEAVQEKISRYNQGNPSPSRRVGRALILAEPLSVDKNEITDKQYINQGAVLSNRADLVALLFADDGSGGVIKLNKNNAMKGDKDVRNEQADTA